MFQFLKYLILYGGMLLLLSSCDIVSEHPLHDEQSTVFEPSFVGRWANEEGVPLFLIERKAGYNAYIVTDLDSKEANHQYEVALTRLADGRTYFDIYPLFEPRSPLHKNFGIGYVWIDDDDKLRAKLLNKPKWFLGQVENGNILTPYSLHEEGGFTGDIVALRMSREELRSFILRFADDPEAFEEMEPLHRIE